MSISRSIVNHVLGQKKAVLSQDASSDQNLPTSASIADLKIRSVMCVPLLTPDREALGIIQLDTSDRKQFLQEDLDVLAAVASQAAIAIQNAAMHESLLERERVNRDLKLAEQVQKRFLPQSVPSVPGFEFFAHYDPAYEVGGDYYDFVPLPERPAGHRRGRRLGQGGRRRADDGQVLGRHPVLHPDRGFPGGRRQRAEQPALLRRDRGEIHHAQPERPRHPEADLDAGLGGHLPVAGPPGQRHVDEIGEEIAGFPLGIIPESDYKQTEVKLYPGDVVAVFSDGVTDARNLREELYESRENRRLLRKVAETPGGPRPSAGRSSRTSASSPPATSRSTTSP